MRVLWAALMMGAFIQAHAQGGDQPTPGSKTAPPGVAGTKTPAREPAVSGKANSKPKVGPRSQPASKRTPAAPARSARKRSPDTVNLGTTSITGNQELPKVLYIVPWKQSNLGDVVGRPANTLLDEVLAPLDPAVFERRLKYYETLNGAKEKE